MLLHTGLWTTPLLTSKLRTQHHSCHQLYSSTSGQFGIWRIHCLCFQKKHDADTCDQEHLHRNWRQMFASRQSTHFRWTPLKRWVFGFLEETIFSDYCCNWKYGITVAVSGKLERTWEENSLYFLWFFWNRLCWEFRLLSNYRSRMKHGVKIQNATTEFLCYLLVWNSETVLSSSLNFLVTNTVKQPRY